MAPSSLHNYPVQTPSLTHTCSTKLLHVEFPSVLPLNMNPAQQHVPSSNKLCFAALEQAVIDSRAREAKTEQRIEMLLNGFLKLERFMTEQQTPPTPLKISPIDIIPVWPSPTG